SFSLSRFARRLARGLKSLPIRKKLPGRAAPSLECLEDRTLMTAAPTFSLDASGNLIRALGASRKVVETHVSEFKIDSKGEVFGLAPNDNLEVMNSAGTVLKTVAGVQSLMANPTAGAIEVLHTDGELEEWVGTRTTTLASGVDDFKVNTT